MLNSAALSLEQAPPVSIPVRFFLTAPLFGLAAALVALVYGPDLLASTWSPTVLAFSHLLTLGFLSMVMCGAMLQMLPVVAAAPVPAVVAVGTLVHILLVLGTGLLAGAFLSLQVGWMRLALVLLGTGFVLFLSATAVALKRAPGANATATGVGLALLSLAVTVVVGLFLGSGLLGIGGLERMPDLVRGHIGWALSGWVGLLLLAVSYQVVPMFQVTPEYPAWMKKGLAWWLWLGLLGWSLLLFGANQGYWAQFWPAVGMAPVMAVFSLFAAVTLRLQSRRKRRISGVTLMFWRSAMVCLLGCVLLWILRQLQPGLLASVHYLFLLGLLLIWVFGMMPLKSRLRRMRGKEGGAPTTAMKRPNG